MIGTLEAMIVDCPDPRVLARFYSEVLGAEIVGNDEDWAEIVLPGTNQPLLAFQQVENFVAPTWPTQDVPQQAHLDIRVGDLDAAETAVLALGATRAGSDTPTFRVYLDPAGHPFCLIIAAD